ncbi:MAG: CopD family protein [Pseudomonadales bacterium]|jgi:putative membrane protein|nr:CopD family protein [Pseudomonadales bacterium]
MSTALFPWLKAFHIIFMVCWFAGIFYLPRLFVNHAMDASAAVHERLCIMERKLYRFITPLAFLSVIFGLWLLFAYNETYGYLRSGWMHAKLALVTLLAIYHWICGRIVRDFAAGRNVRSHVFYRWFNELPVLILFGTVILVVVRPF